jgi:transposase
VVSLNNATHHRNSTQSAIFSTLEYTILPEPPVRFIDAFVEALSLQIVGFSVQTSKGEGLPSCDTKIFLKIYLYVYLNVLRSSRKLEKECARNIELQWLLCAIIPYYHNISDFRKQNPAGLKNLFKLFVSFLKDAELIGCKIIPIDGTKSRAHNSKKANFNQKKMERHLVYIEE